MVINNFVLCNYNLHKYINFGIFFIVITKFTKYIFINKFK